MADFPDYNGRWFPASEQRPRRPPKQVSGHMSEFIPRTRNFTSQLEEESFEEKQLVVPPLAEFEDDGFPDQLDLTEQDTRQEQMEIMEEEQRRIDVSRKNLFDSATPTAFNPTIGPESTRLKSVIAKHQCDLLQKQGLREAMEKSCDQHRGKKEVLKSKSDFVRSFLENCGEELKNISEKMKETRWTWAGGASLKGLQRSMLMELSCWILWEKQLKFNQKIEFGVKGNYWYDFLEKCYSMARDSRSRRLKRDLKELLQLELAVEWLQDVAADEYERSGDDPRKDNCGWEALTNPKEVESRDPEVVMEQNHRHKTIWRKMRTGEVKTAQKASRQYFQESMTAATIEGYLVWRTDETPNRQKICDNIIQRLLWRDSCLCVSQQRKERVLEERALYGLLGGDLDALQKNPLCLSWEDWSWAQFSVNMGRYCDRLMCELLEKELQNELVSIDIDREAMCSNGKSKPVNTASGILEDMQRERTTANMDINNPYAVIQCMMITHRDQPEKIKQQLTDYALDIIRAYANSNVPKGRSDPWKPFKEVLQKLGFSHSEQGLEGKGMHTIKEFTERRLDPYSFLRFSVHLCLSFDLTKGARRESKVQKEDKKWDQLVSAYVAQLIFSHEYELIPVYIGYLSKQMQITLYPIFLNALGPKEAQNHLQNFLQLENSFMLEDVIKQVKRDHVKMTFEKAETKELGFVEETDKIKIKALKCYSDEDFDAYVEDVNLLFREFANGARHRSVILLNKNLDERTQGSSESKYNDTDGQSECDDWKDYAALLQYYYDEINMKGLARNSDKREDSSDSYQGYFKSVKKVLENKDWLPGARTLMARAKATHSIVDQFLQISVESKSGGFDEAQEVINIIADDEYRLHRRFQQDKMLPKLLDHVQELFVKSTDAEKRKIYKYKDTSADAKRT